MRIRNALLGLLAWPCLCAASTPEEQEPVTWAQRAEIVAVVMVDGASIDYQEHEGKKWACDSRVEATVIDSVKGTAEKATVRFLVTGGAPTPGARYLVFLERPIAKGEVQEFTPPWTENRQSFEPCYSNSTDLRTPATNMAAFLMRWNPATDAIEDWVTVPWGITAPNDPSIRTQHASVRSIEVDGRIVDEPSFSDGIVDSNQPLLNDHSWEWTSYRAHLVRALAGSVEADPSMAGFRPAPHWTKPFTTLEGKAGLPAADRLQVRGRTVGRQTICPVREDCAAAWYEIEATHFRAAATDPWLSIEGRPALVAVCNQYSVAISEEFIFDLRRRDVPDVEGSGTRCDTQGAKRFPFDYIVDNAEVFSAKVELPGGQSGPVMRSDDERRLIVPADADWVLVGEWNVPYPDSDTDLMHVARFTRSIIALDGEHYRVSSGTIVSGCCWWPKVYRLDTLAADTFGDPWFEATYVVNADGSLSVHAKDAPVAVWLPTPPEHRFSSRWRDGAD